MKNLIINALTTALLCLCIQGVQAAEIAVVPKPLSVTAGKGSFVPGRELAIIINDESLKHPARIFGKAIEPLIGQIPPVLRNAPKLKKTIRLNLSASLGDEEYTLKSDKKGVVIEGGSPKAVFYGLQTLRQLFDGRTIPEVTIHDKPTFGYRGGMLDVSRHFFPAEDVKRYIDILALHKMNTFHFHLTDDQGWRIEIKRYPELTEIGSVRKKTLVGHLYSPTGYDDKAYGGYYTQDEIRDIVRYATERYIEVVPEIEMPGHGLAALTSYNWLGCTGGPYEVWPRWGVSDDVFCAGKETTFEFLQNVLAEVIALFPSKYIHIGGDECPKGKWEQCPACQQRIRENNLKDEHELQSYLVRRIEKWLTEHGRNIIGWDEILEGGVSKTATIMSWRGAAGGITAACQGNHVIMAPNDNCYLDYAQTADPAKNGEPLGIGGYLPVEQVYRLDPYNKLRPEQRQYILGVQGNLWTEYIPDFTHAQRMLLPRLAAIAEVGWAYDRKDYRDFVKRMESLRQVYEAAGYPYSPYLFEGIE